MTKIFAALLMMVIIAIPVLLIILTIRAFMRKSVIPIAIATGVCFASLLPLTILGTLTDPATWCEHEREIVSTTQPTCTQQGKIIEYCSECDTEVTSYIDKISHNYQFSETVEATCTQPGYTLEKCTMCSATQKTKTKKIDHSWVTETVEATCTEEGYTLEKCRNCSATGKKSRISKLNHDMKEVSRVESTVEVEGKVVYRCKMCQYEETRAIEKLPPPSYIEGVTYGEIYKAYKANELRADDLYKNNRYRITAQINGIETDGLFNLTGGATLTMLIRVDNTRVFFFAEFEKDQEEALKKVNVGDTITFEGECLNAASWVDCKLIIK